MKTRFSETRGPLKALVIACWSIVTVLDLGLPPRGERQASSAREVNHLLVR